MILDPSVRYRGHLPIAESAMGRLHEAVADSVGLRDGRLHEDSGSFSSRRQPSRGSVICEG